jgi:hypothetical protein
MSHHATAKARSKPINVGSTVALELAAGNVVVGEVTEDYGGIGVGGRRMVRVRVMLDEWSPPLDLDVAAERLVVVRQ